MQRLGYRQVGRDFPVFLHPKTNEEYALARTERKVGPGHTGFVCHAGPDVTLEDDLRRRDLSINAIAQGQDGALVDPWGGSADLDARRLRHVSAAFVEDPLRVFRAARFASQLGAFEFKVVPETLRLMTDMCRQDLLAELAAGRDGAGHVFRCFACVWRATPMVRRIRIDTQRVGVRQRTRIAIARTAGTLRCVGLAVGRGCGDNAGGTPESTERVSPRRSRRCSPWARSGRLAHVSSGPAARCDESHQSVEATGLVRTSGYDRSRVRLSRSVGAGGASTECCRCGVGTVAQPRS